MWVSCIILCLLKSTTSNLLASDRIISIQPCLAVMYLMHQRLFRKSIHKKVQQKVAALNNYIAISNSMFVLIEKFFKDFFNFPEAGVNIKNMRRFQIV
jgi:hypothetical protein